MPLTATCISCTVKRIALILTHKANFSYFFQISDCSLQCFTDWIHSSPSHYCSMQVYFLPTLFFVSCLHPPSSCSAVSQRKYIFLFVCMCLCLWYYVCTFLHTVCIKKKIYNFNWLNSTGLINVSHFKLMRGLGDLRNPFMLY